MNYRHQFEKYISEEKIQDRVKELAKEIDSFYSTKVSIDNPLNILCVLKGAFVFCSDLVRNLKVPLVVDFIRLSSYENQMITTGKVTCQFDTLKNVTGKHILIIEDIVDTGLTLKYLITNLRDRNCASFEVATLLNKESRRQVPIKANFCAFEIENEFVIGYGLDLDQQYRELPFIAIVLDEN